MFWKGKFLIGIQHDSVGISQDSRIENHVTMSGKNDESVIDYDRSTSDSSGSLINVDIIEIQTEIKSLTQ